jgi:hypothetical protein
MGITQTILERMENNMLKWYGHVLRMAWANNDLAAGRKKKRKTRNEVGKVNVKSDETDEFNTWRRGKQATTTKSDWEPVTGATLGNWYRQKSKAVPLHAMEALVGEGGTAPTHSLPRHFMGVSSQRLALPALYPWEKNTGTHCTGDWVGLRAGLDTEARGKILCLCGDRITITQSSSA